MHIFRHIFQSCSLHATFYAPETCTGIKKSSNKQEFLPTTYKRHIRAVINFLDLVLERGRQSTPARSSPESLFAKSFQKTDVTDPDQPPFLLKHEGGLAA